MREWVSERVCVDVGGGSAGVEMRVWVQCDDRYYCVVAIVVIVVIVDDYSSNCLWLQLLNVLESCVRELGVRACSGNAGNSK